MSIFLGGPFGRMLSGDASWPGGSSWVRHPVTHAIFNLPAAGVELLDCFRGLNYAQHGLPRPLVAGRRLFGEDLGILEIQWL